MASGVGANDSFPAHGAFTVCDALASEKTVEPIPLEADPL